MLRGLSAEAFVISSLYSTVKIKHKMLRKIIILLLLSTSCCKGLKIFGSLSFGTHSHFAIGDAILKTLWKAGHEITVMSPFPQKVAMKNYRDISTADTLVKFQSGKVVPSN